MVTSPTRHCLDVGNDELIILLCSGGITIGLKRDVGKEGGGGGGGIPREPLPVAGSKTNQMSRVNILGMINLSRCNRSSHL